MYRPLYLAAVTFAALQCAVRPLAAQQTIFNVPSQDVLNSGAVYVELDVPFRLAEPKFVSLVPRVVIGLGRNMEGGLNLPGFVNVGDKLWTAILVLKRRDWLDSLGNVSLTYGAHGYLPLAESSTSQARDIGIFGYATVGKAFEQLRIAAGPYVATSSVTATKTELGILGSLELTLANWFTVAVDGFSGKNALGYISPGVVILPFTGASIYGAYQISNISRDADTFLIELGYAF